MSSMQRISPLILMASVALLSTPAMGQSQGDDGREWDQARARLMQSHDMTVHQSIDRWKQLVASDRLGFSTYAGFLLTYPGYPQEEKIRRFAEQAALRESPDAQSVIAFFERFPPLTSEAAGRYAVSLAALRQPEAKVRAIAAWRGGSLNPMDETTLLTLYRNALTPADHDARMDELLWQGAKAQAERQISFVSAANRNAFMERLAMLQGSPPGTLGITLPSGIGRDPGYVYNRAVQARTSGNLPSAITLLANRPPLSAPVPEPEKWVKELLTAARGTGSENAVKIAESIDDAFAPGTDISQLSFRLRDDYTSLMWLGGTQALWNLGDAGAAPRRCSTATARRRRRRARAPRASTGPAARSPRPAILAGANRYFEMAAAYPTLLRPALA
jgi:soluble lytic murein transglycosylase